MANFISESKMSSKSTNNKPVSIKRTCLTLAIAQSLLLGAAGVQSATITVTSALDDGTDCTLREAIANANDITSGDLMNDCSAGTPNDTDDIIFDNSLSGSTITLGGSQLIITTDINIDGDLNNDNNPDIIVSGNDQSSVLNIYDAAVNLEGLTISAGFFDSNATAGGGISASNSTVSLSNSTVSNNSAGFFGGGIFATNNSSISLSNSTVSDNTVVFLGGGIFASDYSTISLSNSTVSDNNATNFGGGIYASNNSTISLNSSTVSSNSADAGGGISTTNNSTINLSNSTVSDNSATNYGGGIFSQVSSTISLSNSTVSNNYAADYGGGLFATNNTTINLTNSIIANNTGSEDCYLVTQSSTSISTNINNHFGDANCDGTADGDPMLGPLQNNGGPTLTHLPLTGSPVIDAGDNTTAAGSFDQRGLTRIFGGTVDIGAVEVVAAVPGEIQFNIATAIVAENTATAMLTVQRTGGSEGAVGISFASNNTTAIAGLDYTAVGGTLNWPDGDMADRTINIAIIDDSLHEDDETFSVALSTPTGGATLGLDNAVVTITDNDLLENLIFADGFED